MSNTTKENLNTLIKAIGAVGMLIIGVWLKDYVETQKELKDKLEQVYIASVTQGIRDSLQNANISNNTTDIVAHKIETDRAIQQLQQSMLVAQTQLNLILQDEKN